MNRILKWLVPIALLSRSMAATGPIAVTTPGTGASTTNFTVN